MPIDAVAVRDVVVVLPGIMGSELVDTDGRALWSVSPTRLLPAIRALAAHRLDLPKDLGDGEAPDGVRATKLVDSLHVVPGLWTPVSGYDRLLKFLRGPRFQFVEADPDEHERMPNLLPFPYDWRLSNRTNARRLAKVALPALERWRSQPGMRDAKLVLIAHSMGGLVARWFAECEGGAEFVRTIVTLGTPHRGSLRALTALANGLEPGLGPIRLELTSLARSLPSIHQLLPQYDCVVRDDRQRVGLDAMAASIPGLNLTLDLVRDAAAFHAALAANPAPRYDLHKVAGIRQPTPTTARITEDGVQAFDDIDGLNQGGDGTVPYLAAQPLAGRGQQVHDIADQHGELQANDAIFDLVDGILSREQVVWQDVPGRDFGVVMRDLWVAGDAPLLVIVDDHARRMLVTVHDEAGRAVLGPVPAVAGKADLGVLAPGGYRAVVHPHGEPRTRVAKTFLVMDRA